MQTETKPRFYLPELDGLRFIAFMLVFIHNANPILKGTFLEKFSEYSWFGVDLFFCLSGFLITKLLVMEHEQTGKINIRNFYVRRALRIWPLYFFYIIVGSIIIAPVEGRNINLTWHIASLSTFTFNFGYFALLPSPILIFVHLWSISYEEQFYLWIPWLVQKLAHATNLTRIWWMLMLLAAGLTIRSICIGLEIRATAIYFLPFTHFDSMLGGIALGLGLFDPILNRIKREFLWIATLTCITLFFIFPNNDETRWSLMFTYIIVGIFTTIIVFLLTKQSNSFIGNRLFVSLGRISYGLYVFHFGVFSLASLLYTEMFQTEPSDIASSHPWVLLIAFSITVALSIITHQMLEKPFLKLKRKFSMAI